MENEHVEVEIGVPGSVTAAAHVKNEHIEADVENEHVEVEVGIPHKVTAAT